MWAYGEYDNGEYEEHDEPEDGGAGTVNMSLGAQMNMSAGVSFLVSAAVLLFN
jgi:hypothetical protein